MNSGLQQYRADLHVHTALSPCAEADLTPPAILAAARRRQVNLIGVVDHNAAGNACAMERAALAAMEDEGIRVHVLPGLEVESSEGVHVVCLCESGEAAEEFQSLVWPRLPKAAHRPEVLGEQWLVDEQGRLVAQERRLLLRAMDMTLSEICCEGRRRGCLMVPAHVTRRGHGLLGVLGLVPADLRVDALELGPVSIPLSERAEAELGRHPCIHSSDAHRAEEIGTACTEFRMAEPTVAELRLALAGEKGRHAMPLPMET